MPLIVVQTSSMQLHCLVKIFYLYQLKSLFISCYELSVTWSLKQISNRFALLSQKLLQESERNFFKHVSTVNLLTDLEIAVLNGFWSSFLSYFGENFFLVRHESLWESGTILCLLNYLPTDFNPLSLLSGRFIFAVVDYIVCYNPMPMAPFYSPLQLSKRNLQGRRNTIQGQITQNILTSFDGRCRFPRDHCWLAFVLGAQPRYTCSSLLQWLRGVHVRSDGWVLINLVTLTFPPKGSSTGLWNRQLP